MQEDCCKDIKEKLRVVGRIHCSLAVLMAADCLGDHAGDDAGEDVASAASRHARISCRVDPDSSVAVGDESVISLQHNDGAMRHREVARDLYTLLLNSIDA